jgi:hypothetical protein
MAYEVNAVIEWVQFPAERKHEYQLLFQLQSHWIEV